jgi:hypothetical protein
MTMTKIVTSLVTRYDLACGNDNLDKVTQLS